VAFGSLESATLGSLLLLVRSEGPQRFRMRLGPHVRKQRFQNPLVDPLDIPSGRRTPGEVVVALQFPALESRSFQRPRMFGDELQ
jgi:hypothetical protein